MSHHWLVAGVGRSGTTAVYEALQNMTRRSRPRFSYFYEPYLWGPPTWGPKFRRVAEAFTTTGSIHADGLRLHLATPLFASEAQEQSPGHGEFVKGLFGKHKASLTKIIRGCGRLKDYLDLVPDVRIVLVMRNPLDCVNSVVGNFSFFGDEFHPSDMPRFRRELEALGRTQPKFDTECQAATAWWNEMNQAALRTVQCHRERVFIAPYEAYTSDRKATLRLLVKFLSVNVKNDVMKTVGASLDHPVGPVTTTINLRADDVDHITPFQAAYFDSIQRLSDIPIKDTGRSMLEKAGGKYRALDPGAFAPDVPRDASPLRVRAMLRREREARRIATAGIRRAANDLRGVESDLSDKGFRGP